MNQEPSSESIEKRLRDLDSDAKKSGYLLNPDMAFTKGLVEGLLVNNERYGYESCPCRLSFGDLKTDRDIICPCDYRDEDLNEYGACFCGLYVSEQIVSLNQPAPVVPERRPLLRDQVQEPNQLQNNRLPYPIFRCKVCGYLCARTSPPEKCPICKVNKDRFEIFLQ